jgi:hypothetical protein
MPLKPSLNFVFGQGRLGRFSSKNARSGEKQHPLSPGRLIAITYKSPPQTMKIQVIASG